MNRLGEDLRSVLSGIVGKHPHMGGQIAVDLHETKRGKAVKPNVGRFLHRLLVAVRRHSLDEGCPLLLLGIGEKATINAVRLGVCMDVRGNAIVHRLFRYTVDQLAPCPYRISLYRILVHRTLPYSLPYSSRMPSQSLSMVFMRRRICSTYSSMSASVSTVRLGNID